MLQDKLADICPLPRSKPLCFAVTRIFVSFVTRARRARKRIRRTFDHVSPRCPTARSRGHMALMMALCPVPPFAPSANDFIIFEKNQKSYYYFSRVGFGGGSAKNLPISASSPFFVQLARRHLSAPGEFFLKKSQATLDFCTLTRYNGKHKLAHKCLLCADRRRKL